MCENNMAEVIKYIEKKEKSLGRYSDKLRNAIVTIESIFGKTGYCRICDYHQTIHDDRTHALVEKVVISDNIVDDKPFFISDDEIAGKTRYHLCFADHKLGYVDVDDFIGFNIITKPYMLRRCDVLSDASRNLIKEFIKSKRLIAFLKNVANTLDETTEEYREVSEIAEKMAKSTKAN